MKYHVFTGIWFNGRGLSLSVSLNVSIDLLHVKQKVCHMQDLYATLRCLYVILISSITYEHHTRLFIMINPVPVLRARQHEINSRGILKVHNNASNNFLEI
jgi:hypothetical protein